MELCAAFTNVNIEQKQNMRVGFFIFLAGEVLLDLFHAYIGKFRKLEKHVITIVNVMGASYRLVIAIVFSCTFLFLWPLHISRVEPTCGFLLNGCTCVVCLLTITAVGRYKYHNDFYTITPFVIRLKLIMHVVFGVLMLISVLVPVEWSDEWFDIFFIMWICAYNISGVLKHDSFDNTKKQSF
jgi:hypothetical protein